MKSRESSALVRKIHYLLESVVVVADREPRTLKVRSL